MEERGLEAGRGLAGSETTLDLQGDDLPIPSQLGLITGPRRRQGADDLLLMIRAVAILWITQGNPFEARPRRLPAKEMVGCQAWASMEVPVRTTMTPSA